MKFPDRTARSRWGRREIGMLIVAIAVAGLAGWMAMPLLWRQDGGSSNLQPLADRPPDEPPPIAAAEVLRLAPQVPQTVEGLKAEAVQACEQVVRELPGSPEAWAVAALTNMRFGNTSQSAEDWRRALELQPRFSPAYLGLGAIAADKADYAEAEKQLRRALELNPQLPAAYSQLTEVLLQAGKLEEALAVARDYVRHDPRSRESQYWLGQVHLELGRYEEARTSHEAALRLDPQLAASYHSLAIACARLGDRDAALHYRQEFARLNEGQLDEERGRNRLYRDLPAQQEVLAGVHRSAGDVYLLVGQVLKAEAHWLRGAAVASRSLPCREALAALYARQDRPRAALQVLSELQEIDPHQANWWSAAGRCLARLARWEQAELSYRRAIAEDARCSDAYSGLVRMYLEHSREIPDIRLLAEQAVACDPTAHAYLMLCAVLEQLQDRAGARAAIRQARALAPHNPEIREVYEQLQRNAD